MMNGMNWFQLVIGIGSMIVSLIAPLVLLVAAIVHYSLSPKAMRFLIAGSTILLFTSITSAGLNFFLPQALGVEIFSRIVLIQTMTSSVLNASGLLMIGVAAFAGRHDSAARPSSDHVSAPVGSSPYQSGAER